VVRDVVTQVRAGTQRVTIPLDQAAFAKLANGGSALVSFETPNNEVQAFDVPLVATSESGGGRGGAGGGGTPAPPPAIDRRLLIRRGALRVDRKRHVKVRIRCGPTAGNRCKGIVQLLWLGKRLLARRAFSIPAGRYQSVRLTVNRDAYRRLRHRTLHVSIVVLSRGSDGVLRRATQKHIRVVRRR
jgi:hypothetical protein